jgi:hypothetical protein
MWKLIPNTNDNYYASELGDIKRIGGYPLKQKTKHNGYMEVALHIGGKQISRYVHRLVCSAFYGDIPKKMVVNHLDGNKSNNNLSNLEVTTQSENNKHSFATGLKKPTSLKGSRNPKAIVTEQDVIQMRAMYANERRIKPVADKYPQIKSSTIEQIVRYRSWKHVI